MIAICLLLFIAIVPIYSYSACDDIDIHFIIDIDSINNNGDNIKQFIKYVIWNGSSEYSAISIALYGDIPSNMTSSSNIIINLTETHSIYQRSQQENTILSKLQTTFNTISSSTSSSLSSVTLFDAFTNSNNQYKPLRISKKDVLLSRYTAESAAKPDQYFIFDHYNRLLLNYSKNELCSLLYHDNVINKNIHFMMGQKYNSLDIQCNNNNNNVNVYDDERIDSRTFFNIDDIIADIDNKKMEIIYDITCPTNINIDGYGDLSFSNHVQWIDPDVIIKCELVEITNDDDQFEFQIDTTKSYIFVKNYDYDDNTFKIGDYLIGYKDKSSVLTKLGCWSMVYKIIDITDINDDKSKLRLSVSLPSSPTEYIMSANVKGKQPLFTIAHNLTEYDEYDEYDDTQRRQLFISLVSDLVTKELFTNTTSNRLSYSKTNGSIASLTIGESPKFIFNGYGIINASLQYSFDIDISLDFKFDWEVLDNNIYLYYTLNTNYSLLMNFNLDYKEYIQVIINDLIKFGKYFFFYLNQVPVIIKPFIDIDIKITSLPIEVNTELNCKYGEILKVGYEYDQISTYNAKYDIIKENTKYILNDTLLKIWTNISTIIDCVANNYEYGLGQGLTCIYFDYNPSLKRCRCFGSGSLSGATQTEIGTTAYIMDATCDNGYYIKNCTSLLCGTDIIVAINGQNGCNTFLGQYNYECISCIDASFEGNNTITIYENEIKERIPHNNNGCTYDYKISSNDKDLNKCPKNNETTDLFGFDIEINITIGANLYTIIVVYGKNVLNIPFRINIPEFNNTICNNVIDSCSSSSSSVIQASFDIKMNLIFYLGVYVDFTTLTNIIYDIINSASDSEININGIDFTNPATTFLIRNDETPDLTISAQSTCLNACDACLKASNLTSILLATIVLVFYNHILDLNFNSWYIFRLFVFHALSLIEISCGF